MACGIVAPENNKTQRLRISILTSRSAQSKLLSRDTIGIVYLLLSGTGVVFLPTTAKLAYESGSDVLTVAFTRGVFASLLLTIAALLVGQNLRLPRDLYRHSLVVGIAGALFVYNIFGAIVTINISLAILILYLYPMVIAIYEHFLGATRLTPAQWLWGLVACLGLGFILGVNFGQISLVGIGLAMLAMFASVVITLVNVRVADVTGSLVSNIYMSLWGALLFGVALLAFGEFLQPQTTVGWISLTGNGIAYCVSWVAFFAGARILGATRAAMITLIEPPLAALFAWLIFGETFTPLQWFGFAVVLASLFMFEKLARGR